MSLDFWTVRIKEAVRVFSSCETLESRWINTGTAWSSYEEDMCVLFDDVMISEYINMFETANPELSRSLRNLLSRLDDLDQHLDDPARPETVLARPEWTTIRARADAALEQLKTAGPAL